MVQIQFVTVEGCPGADCRTCALAEEVLHQVLGVVGVPLPEHQQGAAREAHLADGRLIETVHLDCDAAVAADLDPRKAPFLLVDGELCLEGPALRPDTLGKAIIDALFPGGWTGA